MVDEEFLDDGCFNLIVDQVFDFFQFYLQYVVFDKLIGDVRDNLDFIIYIGYDGVNQCISSGIVQFQVIIVNYFCFGVCCLNDIIIVNLFGKYD